MKTWFAQVPLKIFKVGFLWWLSGEKSACNAEDAGDLGLIPRLEDPLEEERASNGQRSLVGFP